jgi:hypothetical protein
MIYDLFDIKVDIDIDIDIDIEKWRLHSFELWI